LEEAFPMTDLVLLEREGEIAKVTLNQPAKLNAINNRMWARLREIFVELDGDESLRCVILAGSGDRAFSVGADMKDVTTSGLEYWADARPNGFGGIAFRRSLDIPLIARVNGYALGGGFEMVLGCDIVISAEHAQFGLPEARVGRMPLDGGMVLLQRKMAHNRAMGVMLTGRRFSATGSDRPAASR
jgi:enoyl-CoA hydratase/carnithine racemase